MKLSIKNALWMSLIIITLLVTSAVVFEKYGEYIAVVMNVLSFADLFIIVIGAVVGISWMFLPFIIIIALFILIRKQIVNNITIKQTYDVEEVEEEVN